MKKIILGDTHFNDLQGVDDERLYQNQIKFIKEQLFPYMKENNIKHIIQMGDLTSKRTVLSTYIQHHLKKDFFDYLEANDIVMEYIVGNHDLYYKSSRDIYTFEIFKKAYPNNFIVYNEPTVVDGFLYIPWMLDGDKEKINNLINSNKIKMGFAHAEYQDFYVSKTFKATHGLDKNFFKDIPIVTGHYHIQQRTDNVFYIGTPYQMNWSDYGESKGFFVLDTDKPSFDEMQFIENSSSLKHLKVYLNSDTKTMEITGHQEMIESKLGAKTDYSIFEGHRVKIFVDKDNAFNKKVIEKITALTSRYRVEFLETVTNEESDIETKDFKEYNVANAIVELLDTDYQKTIFDKIHTKAINDMKDE